LASTNVVLSVSASGSAPLGYQWRFNGANLDGATNSLLSLLNVQPEEAGTYSVAVFNSAGSAVSSNAILTVLLPATILQQPQSINIRPTSNVTFSVVAFSPAPLRYQWQRDGSDLLNATNTVLTIPNVQPADSGTYAVIVSDDGGSILSAPAVLLVMVDPVITQNPLSQPVVPGSTVVLSVAVTNNATLPVGYRWRRNGTGFLTNVLNSRTGFLTLANAQPPQTNFQVVVVNPSRPSGFISTSAFLTYVTDSDGDGIPDWWEAAYGFGTNNMADGTNDWDGDTMSNWAEYIAGTDPTNALSYLKVENPTGAPAAATIEFMAVSNRTYTLQYNDALTAAWQTLADVVARATNRVERLGDPAATANRFYRLVTPRQQ
jgi:hypothetical protein